MTGKFCTLISFDRHLAKIKFRGRNNNLILLCLWISRTAFRLQTVMQSWHWKCIQNAKHGLFIAKMHSTINAPLPQQWNNVQTQLTKTLLLKLHSPSVSTEHQVMLTDLYCAVHWGYSLKMARRSIMDHLIRPAISVTAMPLICLVRSIVYKQNTPLMQDCQ